MSSHTDEVRRAYDKVADSYADLLKDDVPSRPVDRGAFAMFASLVGDGKAVEIGCGPGRVSGYLDTIGVDVFGVDLSPEMIRVAGEYYPHLRFEVGTMMDLDIETSSVDGLVSWYSIIHIAPEDLPTVAAEFARIVKPGGHAMLSFQWGVGQTRRIEEAYGHDDLGYTAWRHDPEIVLDAMRAAGFSNYARMRKESEDPEILPQCVLVMRNGTVG